MPKIERADADRGGPTHSQRLQALDRANQIRSERAALKEQLRGGEVGIAELVTEPPACFASASLAELLLAVPGLGQVRVRRLLEGTRLSPTKPVGRLTERQRLALAQALGRPH